jgi:hypothetical protein
MSFLSLKLSTQWYVYTTVMRSVIICLSLGVTERTTVCQLVLALGFACRDFTIMTPTKTSTKEMSAAPARPGMMMAYSRAGK